METMMWLALVALMAVAVAEAKDDCPAWRPMSNMSACLWPRNADGHMSVRPLMDAFEAKCKVRIDWKDQTPPDITDKYTIRMPTECGKCPVRIKCRNRERKEGCFSVEAERETCTEDAYAEACDMPLVPELRTCRWSLMSGTMSGCILARPDVPAWKRDGYQKMDNFFPELNCIKKPSGGCKCCCHPSHPVKEGGKVVCKEVKGLTEHNACPAFSEYNEWSSCTWYPITNVAKEVNEHCDLQSVVPPSLNLKKVIEARIKAEKEDPARQKTLSKIPKEKCGFCSFKVRCRKRPTSAACFGFEVDKKACGADDCEGCHEPCTIDKITEVDEDMVEEEDAERIVGTCLYDELVMAYLRKRGSNFVRMMGKSYWKKRGFTKLMKFIPYGKCVEKNGKCACCCAPYEPSEDGSTCELHNMCKMPEDMGLEWDTYA